MDPKDKTTGGMVSGMSTVDDTQAQPASDTATGMPAEPADKGVISTPEPSITPPPQPVSEPTAMSGMGTEPTAKGVSSMAEPTLTEPKATTSSLTGEEPTAPAAGVSPSEEEEGDETGGTGAAGGGLGR